MNVNKEESQTTHLLIDGRMAVAGYNKLLNNKF